MSVSLAGHALFLPLESVHPALQPAHSPLLTWLSMDDKNNPLTIALQALAPDPLKSRLNDLRRYL